MLNGYHKTLAAQGLKSLLKIPVMPNKNLAIGGDDEMSDVPLLIFKDQGQMTTNPVYPDIIHTPYEKLGTTGDGDTLSMEAFVTNDFQVGKAYDSI